MISPTDLPPVPSFQEARQLFFRSFFFSQGAIELQRDLFQYLALVYPFWVLTGTERRELQEAVVPQCIRYLAAGLHVKIQTELVEQEVQGRSYDLMHALQRPPHARGELLTRILQAVVIRDFFFLQKKGGRPGLVLRDEQAQTITGPYFSHFCHFGLLGHPTGAVAYDRLFAELADAYTRQTVVFARWVQCDVYAQQQLKTILLLHNRHYPQAPLPLPAPF
jgi:hypothetical protein